MAEIDFKNPDYLPIVNRRIERLLAIRKDKKKLAAAKVYYAANYADFISDWMVTYDPRKTPSMVPFILWPKQREYIQWLSDRYAAKEAELRVFTMVPQERVFAAMQQADVVLDRWNQYGIYGYVSVEAMAFGKPVIADIDPLLYPEDCPVLYPTADTLKLMMHEDARKFAGQLGRKYAERVHESSVVAKKSIDAFEAALNL